MDTNSERETKRQGASTGHRPRGSASKQDSAQMCGAHRTASPNVSTGVSTSSRLYDKRMCDRFSDMSCALNILAEDAREQSELRASELVAQSLGMDLVGNVREHARKDIVALSALCSRYDLTVAPFIMNDVHVQQYFIALTGAMIDSDLCHLGTKFVKSVRDITKFIDMVREVVNARGIVRQGARTRAGAGTKRSKRSDTCDTSSTVSSSSSARVTTTCASQCSRTNSRARINVLARERAMDECVAYCASSYSSALFDGIYTKLSTALVYATRAIDDIDPVVRADNSSEVKCARCNTFMRPLEQCVMVCDKCGSIRDINVVQSSCKGPSSDSDVTIAQDDMRGCGGTSTQGMASVRNFDRHLRTWLERLQAIEPFVIPASDLERIHHTIECESIGLSSRTITYAEVVRALKICGLSDSYSEHVPNIVKILKGRAPPVLSHEAQQIILRDFVHIMEVYTSNGIGNIGNKPYYPFFIAKIIKRRFPRGSEPRRLIDYIASQGRETVCKNDEIYRLICERAPAQYDLKYEPEDV